MNANEITAALAEPFDPKDIQWKPQAVKGNRCLAIAYIDARDVQDRLDAVLGVANWQDEYTVLPDGSVTCRLQIKIDGEWVCKMDVGSLSDQSDGGDRLKAAFSDALKRAAVKLGIGRYLYRLDGQWVDYDATKKQITSPPQLPPFALPKSKAPTSGKPPAQPHPTITALARLTNDYAACQSKPDFDKLEGRRKDLWSQLNAEQKAALKDVKEKTVTRLASEAAAK